MQALALPCALHDLGTVPESFRAALHEGSVPRFRHREIAEAPLRRHDALPAERPGSRRTRRDALRAAAAGHHRRPSRRPGERDRSGRAPAGGWKAMRVAAGPEAVEDAASAIRAFLALSPGIPLEPLARPGEAGRLSRRPDGLLTVADGVGSNAGRFPASAPVDELAAELEAARAAEAPAKAGPIATPPPAPGIARLTVVAIAADARLPTHRARRPVCGEHAACPIGETPAAGVAAFRRGAVVIPGEAAVSDREAHPDPRMLSLSVVQVLGEVVTGGVPAGSGC